MSSAEVKKSLKPAEAKRRYEAAMSEPDPAGRLLALEYLVRDGEAWRKQSMTGAGSSGALFAKLGFVIIGAVVLSALAAAAAAAPALLTIAPPLVLGTALAVTAGAAISSFVKNDRMDSILFKAEDTLEGLVQNLKPAAYKDSPLLSDALKKVRGFAEKYLPFKWQEEGLPAVATVKPLSDVWPRTTTNLAKALAPTPLQHAIASLRKNG